MTAMAVVAMLAIAIDWVGKPFRNRKFVGRAYRYPDELRAEMAPRSAAAVEPDAHIWEAQPIFAFPEAPDQTWGQIGNADSSQATFADLVSVETLSTLERVAVYADTLPPSELQGGVLTAGVTTGSTFSSIVDHAPRQVRQVSPESSTSEPGVWKPGDDLWTPTADGSTPTPSDVERRFWQSAVVFLPEIRWYGAENVDRLIDGKPPIRRNRRTGKIETMALAGLHDADQPAPRPYWPNDDVDPFPS